MSRINSPYWRLGIAASSLVLALAVYVFAREYPPAFVAPMQATNPLLLEHGRLFDSAPSLFYTLAIGLLLGVTSADHGRGQLHCLIWTGIALMLELTQIPHIAGTFVAVSENLPRFVANLITPYWAIGTFDLADLLATLLGGMTALGILRFIPTEKKDASTH